MLRPTFSRSQDRRIDRQDPKKVFEGLESLSLQAALGQAAQLEHMLMEGANVNVVDRDGDRVPLHWAAARGHVRCIELLLKAGAYPNVFDAEGRTAATLAREGGHSKACQALGVDPVSGETLSNGQRLTLQVHLNSSAHGGNLFSSLHYPPSAKVMPFVVASIPSPDWHDASRATSPTNSVSTNSVFSGISP